MEQSEQKDPDAGSQPAFAGRLDDKVAALEEVLRQSVLAGEKIFAAINRAMTCISGLEQNLNARNARQDEALGKAFKRIDDLEWKVHNAREIEALSRVSRMHPKARSVIFIGRSEFADNIKYAFLAFVPFAASKGIACYFWTDRPHQYRQLMDAGLPCLPPTVQDWSYDDAKAFLHAKAAVVCDNFHGASHATHIPYALLQGARFIQLWHGAPLKRIGFQHLFSAGGNNQFLSTLLESSGVFDTLVGSCAAAKSEWRQLLAFDGYAPLGYPRNDVFFRDATSRDLINVDRDSFGSMREARRKGNRVILYAPTFRDHMGPDWFERISIDSIAGHCRARGYVFFVNLHPFEQGAVEELRRRHPGVSFIAPYTDSYPVVKETDILMTDYSSLAFDFLHLDRPLVFFRPDHAEFVSKARGLMEDRQSYTPGEVVADIPALKDALDAAVAASLRPEEDPFRAARQSLRQKIFDYHDGRAGERVAELIMERIEAA